MRTRERSEQSTHAEGRGQRRGKHTHATSAKHTQASSLQQRRRLQHVTCTHARAQRAKHASRGQRRGEHTRASSASVRKQTACSGLSTPCVTASARPVHTRERSKRSAPTAGMGEEGTLEAASATRTHADSPQRLQHIICTRASAVGEARRPEAAGTEARKAHSCDLCKHTQASSRQQRRRLQHVTCTHTRSHRAKHASRKPRAEARRAQSMQPRQGTRKQTACTALASPASARKHSERSTHAAVRGERRAHSMQPQQSTCTCMQTLRTSFGM